MYAEFYAGSNGTAQREIIREGGSQYINLLLSDSFNGFVYFLIPCLFLSFL